MCVHLIGCVACVNVNSVGGQAQMSRYVGVSWVRDTKKWEARIRQAGAPQQRLGYFLTEEEAAKAFDAAARRLRGAAAHGGRSGPTAARFRCASHHPRFVVVIGSACRSAPR